MSRMSRKQTIGKRTICTLLPLLLLAALFPACQPTPEEEPVAQKDTEGLVERIEVTEEGISDMAGVSEAQRITRALEAVSQKTGIDITIDADVVLPETDAMPVAHIKSGLLDESVLENIWKLIGNGSGILDGFPRSYYEEQAQLWMEYRDAGNLDKYSSFEEMDAAIAELLAQAAAAPEEPVFLEQDPMEAMQEGLLSDGRTVKFINSFNGWSEQGTVYQMQLNTAGRISFLRDIDAREAFRAYEIGANPINQHLPAIERGELSLQLPERSLEDATAYAEQLIVDLGLGDFTCVGARIAPLLPDAIDWNAGPYPCAYEILFTRQIAGVNVTYNDVISSGGETKYRSDDSPDYMPEWAYERIQLYVDDAGVFGLLFRQPYEVLEISTPSAQIISLEEAIASFEQRIGYQYAAYETGERELCDGAFIRVTEIRLGLARVAEKDAVEQGYLVPAWTFFGTYRLDDYFPDGEGYDGTDALLIVNALDGSIIDPEQGF